MPPKTEAPKHDTDKLKRLDEKLDEALEESFPASDPPTVFGDDPDEKSD